MEAQLTGSIRGDESLRTWIARGGLRGVASLIAWDAALTDEAAEALAEGATDELSSLDLSWNQIGARGAGQLAAIPSVRALRLYHNATGADGACEVASRACRLSRLNMCGNGLGDRGVAALCSERLDGLAELALGWNDIGSEGVRALSGRSWPALAMLNVRANRLDGDDVVRLLALPAVERLGVDENPLGNDGVLALASSPHFPRLAWLNLGGVGFDDAIVDRIVAQMVDGPIALRELRVHDNDLSDRAIAALRAALPEAEVVS